LAPAGAASRSANRRAANAELPTGGYSVQTAILHSGLHGFAVRAPPKSSRHAAHFDPGLVLGERSQIADLVVVWLQNVRIMSPRVRVVHNRYSFRTTGSYPRFHSVAALTVLKVLGIGHIHRESEDVTRLRITRQRNRHRSFAVFRQSGRRVCQRCSSSAHVDLRLVPRKRMRFGAIRP